MAHLSRIYLLFDPVIVLEEPLQSRSVWVKLGLDVRCGQEPSLAAVQSLSKPGPEEEKDEDSDMLDALITNP